MLQILDTCAPVLFIRDPLLKPRRKMGRTEYLTSGFRTLVCMIKPFFT